MLVCVSVLIMMGAMPCKKMEMGVEVTIFCLLSPSTWITVCLLLFVLDALLCQRPLVSLHGPFKACLCVPSQKSMDVVMDASAVRQTREQLDK